MFDGEQRRKGENERETDITFKRLEGNNGIKIIDLIERHHETLHTTEPLAELEVVSPGRFYFPVDAAISIRTTEFALPNAVISYVRDEKGEMIAEVPPLGYQTIQHGTYILELTPTVKIYVEFEGAFTITTGKDQSQTKIQFKDETTINVGARSHHKRPAGTVTTTSDPEDMMAALSTLGSALKTTTCERSYPTLRGHPPTIDLGDELDIPEELEPPKTGIRLELPPEYQYIYVAAPLAYYLGATIVPGDTPKIVTDIGFEHRLDGPREYETEVEHAFKQAFFLDCVTRTEGYYQVDLYERDAIQSKVDLDFATLYQKPIAEQLEKYFTVPYSVIEEYVPKWKTTTHVTTTPDSVEMLPFMVNDLAIVRTPGVQQVSDSELQVAIDDFFRDNAFTRSTAERSGKSRSYVQPAANGSMQQAWVGDDIPLGATKVAKRGYQNRFDRTATEGDISITVICNDQKMTEERDLVNEVYGTRFELPFDVTVRRDLTVEKLRDALASQTDFLHYIGHIDDDGFECADGKLDVSELDGVGVDTFLLNACQSYEQGMELIETGSIGGVVTLSDVINTGAVKIGCMIARLLNRGFPLQSALGIASDESIIGSQYIVVGNGGTAIAQPEGGTPNMCIVESTENRFEVEYKTYTTTESGMGSFNLPLIGSERKSYLNSGTLQTFEVSKEELIEFLKLEDIPVKVNGELRWSEEIDFDAL